MTQAIAHALGIDASDIIAVVRATQTSQNRSRMLVTVVLPRGSIPEALNEFRSAEMEVFDAIRGLYPRFDEGDEDESVEDDAYAALYATDSVDASIYVVDEDGISDEGGSAVAFDELRRIAQKDPAALTEYTVTYVLAARSSAAFRERGDYTLFNDKPEDAMGPITWSREWRYGKIGAWVLCGSEPKRLLYSWQSSL